MTIPTYTGPGGARLEGAPSVYREHALNESALCSCGRGFPGWHPCPYALLQPGEMPRHPLHWPGLMVEIGQGDRRTRAVVDDVALDQNGGVVVLHVRADGGGPEPERRALLPHSITYVREASRG